ncbi:MAG: cation:proton antiporter [Gemmatimonadales bacterium]
MPLSEIVLVLAGLLTLAIISAGAFRKVPIPYTVLLVIIGMLFAEGEHVWPALEPLREFRLSPDLVFFILLPALIFESGFNLPARQLLKDLAPVLVLAVPALVISTLVVGVGLSFLGMQLIIAMLFGALISATDPVAVIALFKELGAPERLTVLVEGESLLNDATAIVVFGILLAIAVGGESLNWSSAEGIVIEFLWVFVGGALVGAVIGLIASELLYHLRVPVSAVLTMSLVVAYGSFILAEHILHVSGVMAGATSAIALSGFGMTRLRHEASDAAMEFWEVIALICNSLLFLLIGLSVDIGALVSALVPAIITLLLLLAARAAAVYTLIPLTTRLFALPRVSMSERLIMWWGGLKGGLAIAIVLSIPEQLPGRDVLVNITLAVVLITLLVNAPTIRPLMSWLGLDRLTEEEKLELRHALVSAREEAEHILERCHKPEIISTETHGEVSSRTSDTFKPPETGISDSRYEQDRYVAELLAARWEMDEYKSLYEQGMIPQHVYLDIRNELHNKHDLDAQTSAEVRPSIVLRFESALIKLLREKNWSAPLLSLYQSMRLAEHLRRDIAGILVCSTVIENLAARHDLNEETRKEVTGIYEEALANHVANLREIQREYPDFYQRFESRFSTQVSLTGAIRHVRGAFHDGELSSKAYNVIERRVKRALAEMAPLSKRIPAISPEQLRDTVPLFSDLPESSLMRLTQGSQRATYLAGDTIIEYGKKGDAFYVITQGEVDVFRRVSGQEKQIGSLGAGDFIGETSLLYSGGAKAHTRGATMRARSFVNVLRLPNREIRALMKKHPQLRGKMLEEHHRRTDFVHGVRTRASEPGDEEKGSAD